jgi:Ca2+:H+ antiporter
MSIADHDRTPAWAIAGPLAAALMVVAKMTGLVPAGAGLVLLLSAILLLVAVFSAVHHAEVLALRLGDPFGSILLAVAVTVIEVALIVSILMSGAEGSDAVARDTVYSAVMIVLGGIVGLCLVLGAIRHGEQRFTTDGAQGPLAVLSTLAVVSLVLPNYTVATVGPTLAPVQLAVAATLSLVLYGVFVFVQTVRHRAYFLDAEAAGTGDGAPPPSDRTALASFVLLLIALTSVVLLAKVLSGPLGEAVSAAGLPKAVLGVAIAAMVLMPEGLAASRAAQANRLQSAINLALGSAIASIGLTIPTVAAVSLWTGQTLLLGLSPEETVLLVLTLLVTTQTLATGRTTVLQGTVHLVIFAIFLLLAFMP